MPDKIYNQVDKYISDLFVKKDPVLESVTKSIEESGIPQISVSPNQGSFLQVMALACNAKKILEVGTLAGYSTVWMGRALPADGQLISIEVEPKHAEVASSNIKKAGLEEKVSIRIGKAIEVLPQLIKENAGPFDMIFIDADKKPYAEYFQLALDLSRPGTLIIADNVIREGKVLDGSNDDEMVKGARRFNSVLADETRVTATIVQTIGDKDHDGMALAVVKRQ